MFVLWMVIGTALVGGLDADVLQYLPGMGYAPGSPRPHKDKLDTTWPPGFCNGYDCPKYRVIEQHKEYELREYSLSQWVSAHEEGVSWAPSKYSLFMKLFRYISGINKENRKIAMTVPVINRITPGQDKFTISFYMPPKVGAPPQPNDPAVSLTQLPKQRVYVRAFGGYLMFSFSPWATQARNLRRAIGDPSKYHTDFYYTVGYDSPMKFFNRHNEIWFIAK